MTYIWNPESSEVVYVPNTMLMASVQLGVAILGACLPTYGPLLNVARKGMNKVKLVMGMTVSISWGSRKTSGSRGLIISQDSGGRDLVPRLLLLLVARLEARGASSRARARPISSVRRQWLSRHW